MYYNIDVINSKLNLFSKKFYFNKVLSGALFFLLFWIILSLLFLFLEYVLYLNPNIKLFSIICYVLMSFFSFFYFIIIPLLKYFGVLRGLSKRKINSIIVEFFPEIKDKLLNIIELSSYSNDNVYSEELLIASIDQKISEIRFIDFNKAISIKQYSKFFFFLIGAFLISILIFYVNPKFYNEASYRIVNYKMTFQKPLPYNFSILNESLFIGKGDDFNLKVTINGLKENDPVNLIMSGKTYLMKRDSIGYYSYNFNNINNDIYFQFSINNFSSQIFKIEILEKPILNNFSAFLSKPGYTSLKNEEISNITEISLPVGTYVKFLFTALNTDTVVLTDNVKSYSITKTKKNEFIFEKQILDDQTINIDLKNINFYLPNYLKINIKSVTDEFPSISLNKLSDSIEFTKVYFRGKISDDYGFSKLQFKIKLSEKVDSIINLNFLNNVPDQEFFYAFDFSSYKSANENLSYYFEIYDNDIINGPKSAISEVFVFNFPDAEEISDFQNQQFNEIENIFENSLNLADRLKEDLSELKKKMLNSDLSEWERKEIQKNLTTTKNNLEKEIENIKEKNEELNNFMKSFSEQDQRIVDKQNQIKELLDQVFSEDLKKMLDEFNKMMSEFNKDNLNNSKEKLDISLDDLSKQLDRNLEMLKKMQVEKKLDLLSKNMDDIVNNQQKNLDEIDNKFQKEKLAEDQNKQKSALENVQKEYDDLKKLNEELENPLNLFDFKNEFEEIKNEFSNSLNTIQKDNKKKSKESLQKNSNNLKNLQFNLNQMIDTLFKEQNSENLADLQQILDNLLTFSFNQERVINSTKNKNFNSITFAEQKKLFNDFSIVKDSLYALAKRELALNNVINKELVAIQNDFVSIENDYELNSVQSVSVNQQKVLTSVNNLSLFLSEIIKKLQEQEANSKPGNQNCNKPGNKPNPNSMSSSMKSMQKSLQQQLEKIMQMMKDGSQGKGLQNEMGKAISQQEAMHDLLQKMMNQGNVGSGAQETLKQADQLLNKVREDILRNNISSSTIDRQKQILTRLLEAEKSENERDFEEKRKSTTANEQFSSKTNYKKDDNKFEINYEEKLIKNKLILNSFYQKKFQSYVFVLDSINGEIHKNRVINE